MLAAPHVFEVPVHVAQHDEVEQAVVVEVDPGRAGGPGVSWRRVASRAGAHSDIGEGAVAVVVVQVIAAVARDVQVFEAVVVVVADSHAHAVAHALQPGLLGHVLEGAVLALVVEPVPVFGRLLLRDCALGVGSPSGAPLTKNRSSRPSLS